MNKLKEIRSKKGFTQADLANAMGISQQTISSYEKGSRMMDNNFIVRVSLFLQVTPNELLSFDEAYKKYSDYLISLTNKDVIN